MNLEPIVRDYTYHIYNRGINGENIFTNGENKLYFLKLAGKYLGGNASMFAYCLMDNHFHLLVRIDCDGDIMTQKLSNLFNAYAKAFNKATGRTGSLFEKHFKRIRIDDENYLRQLIVYIHLNPTHHFDIDFTGFKYSSYNSFLSDKETRLMRDDVIELFGDIENFKYTHLFRRDILDEKYTLE